MTVWVRRTFSEMGSFVPHLFRWCRQIFEISGCLSLTSLGCGDATAVTVSEHVRAAKYKPVFGLTQQLLSLRPASVQNKGSLMQHIMHSNGVQVLQKKTHENSFEHKPVGLGLVQGVFEGHACTVNEKDVPTNKCKLKWGAEFIPRSVCQIQKHRYTTCTHSSLVHSIRSVVKLFFHPWLLGMTQRTKQQWNITWDPLIKTVINTANWGVNRTWMST